MTKRVIVIGLMAVAATTACMTAAAAPPDSTKVTQDAEMLRFIARALPWYPNSTFSVVSDDRHMTPSGSFRLVEVARTGAPQFFSGNTVVLVDEPANVVWFGTIGQVPKEEGDDDGTQVKAFISDWLPEQLFKNMRIRSKVDWDVKSTGPSALLPFDLVVDTGYGSFRRPGGVTVDGAYLVIGGPLPADKDPVAYRRELFDDSDEVMWDHKNNGEPLEIVEFSDFECPACRAKWPLIKGQLAAHGKEILHGMVNFPLQAIHPWAFRAASAAWCVDQLKPEALARFKETFYGLQSDMENALVTPTSVDFVVGENLDEKAFRACYLKQPSLDGVLAQMALGNRLGIMSTPTYFFNGWLVQVPDPAMLGELVPTLIAGEDPSPGKLGK